VKSIYTYMHQADNKRKGVCSLNFAVFKNNYLGLCVLF
jgi:hypothetical protein